MGLECQRRWHCIAIHGPAWIRVPGSCSRSCTNSLSIFSDGKPNYRLAYDTIGLGEQRRANHIDLIGTYAARARLEMLSRVNAESHIEECMDDVYGRQRVWIKYFNALAAHTKVNIFFVSGTGRCEIT